MKRYSITMASGRPALIQSDDGEIVLYSEAAAHIEALEKELKDRSESQEELSHQLNIHEHERVAPLVKRIKALEWYIRRGKPPCA